MLSAFPRAGIPIPLFLSFDGKRVSSSCESSHPSFCSHVLSQEGLTCEQIVARMCCQILQVHPVLAAFVAPACRQEGTFLVFSHIQSQQGLLAQHVLAQIGFLFRGPLSFTAELDSPVRYCTGFHLLIARVSHHNGT